MNAADFIAAKRAEMAARLESRHKQEIDSKKERLERAESECVDENRRRPNVQQFISTFEAEKRAVGAAHDEAAAAHAAGAAVNDAALLSAADALVRMQALLAQSIMDLPPYEVRSAQKCLQDFTERNTQLRELAAPKKKFAFKSRAAVKTTPAVAVSSSEAASTASVAASIDAVTSNISNSTTSALSTSTASATASILARYESQCVKLHDLSGARVHHGPGSFAGRDAWIARAHDCKITICDHAGAVRIDHVERCEIFVGAVAGSVHLEHAIDCVFVLATRQIRIHSAHGCDFYLHAQSNPIIEHTDRVRFAPFCLRYAEQPVHALAAQLDATRNLWCEVNDFNWLKNEQHSPNWCELAVAERRAPIELDARTGEVVGATEVLEVAATTEAANGAAAAAVSSSSVINAAASVDSDEEL